MLVAYFFIISKLYYDTKEATLLAAGFSTD